MSIPKKVLFIGLGILALGILVLTLGLLQSPALWQAFQCGYDLGINNSSLTQEQISEYCNNNQILRIENEEEEATGLIAVGFGVILIVIGLTITGIGGIWLLVRSIRKQRTETPSLLGMSVEMMKTTNNRRIKEEQDD